MRKPFSTSQKYKPLGHTGCTGSDASSIELSSSVAAAGGEDDGRVEAKVAYGDSNVDKVVVDNGDCVRSIGCSCWEVGHGDKGSSLIIHWTSTAATSEWWWVDAVPQEAAWTVEGLEMVKRSEGFHR
jgi:hypothetical protein